jgi:hypothetical protein
LFSESFVILLEKDNYGLSFLDVAAMVATAGPEELRPELAEPKLHFLSK